MYGFYFILLDIARLGKLECGKQAFGVPMDSPFLLVMSPYCTRVAEMFQHIQGIKLRQLVPQFFPIGGAFMVPPLVKVAFAL